MQTKLKSIAIIVAVTGLLCVVRPANAGPASEPCSTNYTLIGPVGSELSTTTNGYPLLTVFVELGQCEALVAYDEVLTDCTGSTTNHLEYTVEVGEMFDPHQYCVEIFDQFGNSILVCTNAYFLTVANADVHPHDIISSVGSVSYLSNGVPVLTVAADPGECTASVTFDAVNNNCDGSSSTQMVAATAQPAALANEQSYCVEIFDQFGNSILECYYFKLIAVDTEAPVITCPGTITSNAAPGTCAAVVTFAPSVQDNCDASPTVSCTPPSGSTFAGGTTPVTCKAIDASGNTNTCTFNVIVLDAAPPVINLKPAITIKDNNHKYRTFSVTDFVASVSDTCSALTANNCVISQVTSDEPDDVPGPGDGSTKNDIKIAANCKSVQLQQERDGAKNGRVYKVTLKVKDAAGNIGEAVARVNVPLSSNGGPAIDSGVAQTVTGCTP